MDYFKQLTETELHEVSCHNEKNHGCRDRCPVWGASKTQKMLSFHPFPQVVDRFEEASFSAGAPILAKNNLLAWGVASLSWPSFY